MRYSEFRIVLLILVADGPPNLDAAPAGCTKDWEKCQSVHLNRTFCVICWMVASLLNPWRLAVGRPDRSLEQAATQIVVNELKGSDELVQQFLLLFARFSRCVVGRKRPVG